MKRLHIHIAVENIERSVTFYNALFGQEPTKTKHDYAKWMLDDPHVNFAISTQSEKLGLDHLGIQVEDADELAAVRKQLKSADIALFDEGETACCYAQSDKSWVQDPSGIPWEAYQTMNDAALFSDSELSSRSLKTDESSCCIPETKGQPGCCAPSAQTVGCCA